MKALAGKLEKVRILLKRDGFGLGMKRIGSTLLKMFKRAKPGDILFVTGGLGVGASSLYRCHNQMEELSNNGFRCSFSIQDSPFLDSYADKFKVFIFHRPVYDGKLEKLIEGIKKNGREIIFETDDLLFDPSFVRKAEYFKAASPAEKETAAKGIGSELVSDPYVKTAVVSTSFLAEKLREKGKQVFVSKNKLSKKDLRMADAILKKGKCGECSGPNCAMSHASCSVIRLGYFSGTASHDKDFAEIGGVLERIMEKYPAVKLHIAGPLNIGERLKNYPGRIVKLPFVGMEKHFENVSAVDINLAPLERNNDFCEAKSELKWIEAGILGIPTVASATRTFREAIREGVDGFVAGTDEEWSAKLERLIGDADLRKRVGEEAQKRVLQDYTTQNGKNEEYYNYLRSKL